MHEKTTASQPPAPVINEPDDSKLPPKSIIKLLKKIYETPSHEGSFSAPHRLHSILKVKYRKKVSLNSIKEWLSGQRSYTYHKPVNYNFPSNPIVAGKIDQQWESDLMFLPDLAQFNDGFKIALVCVDVVSRFAWVEPMKTKHGAATADAMTEILKRSKPRTPEKLHTDAGTEFFNSTFQKLMRKRNIIHFLTDTDSRGKAAIAERFNRTLKGKIYKFLDSNPSNNRYVDVLQDLVDSYNNTVHASIKMKPAEVTVEREGLALWNLYHRYWTDEKDGAALRVKNHKNKKPTTTTAAPDAEEGSAFRGKRRRRLPKNFAYNGPTDFKLSVKRNLEGALSAGDPVRIAGKNHPFFKQYKGNWTEEIFVISRRLQRFPHFVYQVTEIDGTPIKGIFYREELQKVRTPPKSQDFWQIEEILETRKKKSGRLEHLVKWFGYSPKYNSWVDDSDTISV